MNGQTNSAIRLTRADLLLVTGILGDLYAHTDFDTLPQLILSVLERAVAADRVSYNEIDNRRGRWIILDKLHLPETKELAAVLHNHKDEHPLFAHHDQTRSLEALRISDFLTLRQFKQTGLHAEYYRNLGVNYQLASFLNEESEFQIGLACHRGLRDFSERDKQILNLLQPHLRQAYLNARAFTESQQQTELLAKALSASDQGLVCLSNEGRIRWMTDRARLWLRNYFADGKSCLRVLPQSLHFWLQRQRLLSAPKRELFLMEQHCGSMSHSTLMVRFIEDDQEQHWLLLKQTKQGLCVRSFERFGLTPRELEVLHWVVQGKSNPEIAIILARSARTIHKHLERILFKLGVENRVAATTLVRELQEQRID